MKSYKLLMRVGKIILIQYMETNFFNLFIIITKFVEQKSVFKEFNAEITIDLL